MKHLNSSAYQSNHRSEQRKGIESYTVSRKAKDLFVSLKLKQILMGVVGWVLLCLSPLWAMHEDREEEQGSTFSVSNQAQSNKKREHSLSLTTAHMLDEAEDQLYQAIHQGLGLEIDQVMNAYMLLTQKIKSGQITNGTLLDLRDRIKAPEALIDGKISARPKTQHLEGLIHYLEKSTEALEDQELTSALQVLKEQYQDYLQKIQSTKGDELNHLRQIKERISVEGKSGFYRIHALIDMDLLDLQHHHNAAHAYGQHEGVFYKAHEGSNKPLAPGQEYAVYALYRLLNIEVPATLLISVDSDEDLVKGHWPHRMIQASHAVPGESFQTTLEKIAQEKTTEQRKDLSIVNYAHQFVGAVLSLPSDGKANNYIYNQETQLLTPIDNDLSFGSLISQGEHPYLKHCSILFCMSEHLNQPFDQEYAAFLKRQDPGVILLSWLGKIQNKNEQYKHLFTLNQSLERFEDLRLWDHQESKRDYLKKCDEIKEHLEHQRRHFTQEDYKELSLPIQMSWHEIKDVYKRLITLQQALRDNQDITYAQVLEQCVPLSAILYQESLKQKLSPLQTYELIKKTSLTSISNIQIDFQSVAELLRQEKETGRREQVILFPETLAQRFLSTYYPATSLEDAPSLLVLNTSYVYFPSITQSLFKQGFPQSYLEQLIKDGVSYSLLKLLLPLRSSFYLTTHLLDTAFNFHHYDAVQALIEEGVREFRADQAYRYWQHLTVYPQRELFDVFFRVVPYSPELEWKLSLETMFSTKVEVESQEGEKKKEEKLIESLSTIKGDHLKHRSLSADQITWLFDVHGHFIRRNKVGRSDVSWWPEENPQVYFKKRPELPGYEYAATSFMRHLGIEGLPYSELMAFYNAQEGHYPVLATQAIEGDLVKDIWGDDTVFHHLDPDHTQLMILAAMLMNVEDGKEDNYILSPNQQRLISIDNDHAFMPGSIQVKEKSWIRTTVSDKLQAKSLLFGLQEMNNSFTKKVREKINNLNVDQFLEKWLHGLVKVNDRYQGFFSNAAQFFTHSSPTILRIPLSPEFIEGLYHKLYTIKDLFKDPEVTPLELLLRVEPYVGKQYQRAFEDLKNKTVKDRFLKVTQGLYLKSQNGNRVSVTNSREMMEIIHISTQELIGEAHKVKKGPHAAFAQFKSLKQQRETAQKRKRLLMQGHDIDFEQGYTGEGKSLREQQFYLQRFSQHAASLEELSLRYVDALNTQSLQLLKEQQDHRLRNLRVLDLRECEQLGDSSLHLLAEMCPYLNYLNVSGWQELYVIAHPQEYSWSGFFNDVLSDHIRPTLELFPSLQRLVMNNLLKLQRVSLKAFELIRIEGENLPKLQEVALITPFLAYYGIEEGESFYIDDTVDYFYSYHLPLKEIEDLSSYLSEYSGKERSIQNINLMNKDLKLIDIKIVASRFPNLTSLNLMLNNIGDEEAKVIGDSQFLTNLTSLRLWNNKVGDEGAKAIADSQFLTNLKSLELEFDNIGDEGAKAIADSQFLTNITSLNLKGNNISDEGAKAIADSQFLTNLTSLELEFNNVGNEGAKAIDYFYFHYFPLKMVKGLSPYLREYSEKEQLVKNIDLEKKDPKLIDIKIIASRFPNLTSLDLGSNKISDEGIKAIANSQTLINLTSLSLRSNNIGDKGAKAIAESTALTGLTSLNLGWNNIGAEGAVAIAGSQTLTGLTSLDLGSNNIGAEGIRALAGSPTLSNLTSLDLEWNNIGAEGEKVRRESPYLKNTNIRF